MDDPRQTATQYVRTGSTHFASFDTIHKFAKYRPIFNEEYEYLLGVKRT